MLQPYHTIHHNNINDLVSHAYRVFALIVHHMFVRRHRKRRGHGQFLWGGGKHYFVVAHL